MHGVDGAAGSGCRHRGEQGRVKQSKTDLLAFHVAHAGDAGRRKARISTAFGPPADQQAGQEQDGHGAPNRPAMLPVPGHQPQVAGQAGWDEKNGQQLGEVGQRGGILVWVGGIGIEKAAAVGAQHLDRLLRGHRSLGQALGQLPAGRFFQAGNVRIGLEILDHALGDEN